MIPTSGFIRSKLTLKFDQKNFPKKNEFHNNACAFVISMKSGFLRTSIGGIYLDNMPPSIALYI